ncbi:50S ribosomal protein L25 [Melioribacter sp. Ez-97]|uniref:50S ribosomal protein L25 n=1 Tax=Melioribacter sp. Ez-97 TaxID=3423434 RepID=UPI003ED96816
MSELTIKAKRRVLTTKGAVNKLRKAGNVPGIFYVSGQEPIPVYLTESALRPLVYTAETHIINLVIDEDEPRKAIVKDVQFDPVTDKMIHCDIMGISLDHEIQVEVPVVLEGASVGVKEGGILQQLMHKLTITCLPGNIPEHISVDITNLKIGESVHVKDIVTDKYKIDHNEDVVIASVVHARVQEEVPAEETEETQEPEVISKGKSEETEE